MQLKKYHARDVREGLEQIKRELGADAVIVHTSRPRTGAYAGLVEITVGISSSAGNQASSASPSSEYPRHANGSAMGERPRPGVAARPGGFAPEQSRPAVPPNGGFPSWAAPEEPSYPQAQAYEPARPVSDAWGQAPLGAMPAARASDLAGSLNVSLDGLVEELTGQIRYLQTEVRALRLQAEASQAAQAAQAVQAAEAVEAAHAAHAALAAQAAQVAQVAHVTQAFQAAQAAQLDQVTQAAQMAAQAAQAAQAVQMSPKQAGMPTGILDSVRAGVARLQELQADEAPAQAITRLYQGLLSQGMLREHVEEVIARALAEHPEWAAYPGGLPESVEQQLARQITTAGPLWMSRSMRAEMAVLVGPTGVGKTTTLAKIAAHARLVGRKRVGIVCADAFRIGGAYQIETYARLMQIPMAVVSSFSEVREAVEGFGQLDLLLVDTTGRNPWQAEADDTFPLTSYRDLNSDRYDVQYHLCFSASTRTEDLVAMSDEFSYLDPRSLIFTKVDESRSLGGLLSTSWHAGIPLSLIALGHRVPEDILAPTPSDIARWVAQRLRPHV